MTLPPRTPKVGDWVYLNGVRGEITYISLLSGDMDVHTDDGEYLGAIMRYQYDSIVYVDEQDGNDNVNHPAHYTSHPSGVECIEIVRHHNFNVGGAMKYLWRNGLKDEDAQVEDLRKAVWLINDEIKRLGGTP